MMTSLLVFMLSLTTATCRTVVDLTHTLDENAPKWPLDGLGVHNVTFYQMDNLFSGYLNGEMWLAIRHIELYEHIGTHMDAPLHFANGRQSMDEIPADRLMGPGVVIDVTDKVKDNQDYEVTVQDIADYEDKFGRIPPGSIVLMNSGWTRKYPNPTAIFGTNNFSDSSTFSFPGFSIDACKTLYTGRQPTRVSTSSDNKERFAPLSSAIVIGSKHLGQENVTKIQVSVIGVDTPSVDPGNSLTYACHVFLQPLNVPLLEYVANLDSIPQNGTTIVLGAIKTRGGTGGPTRVLAFMTHDDDSTSKSSTMKTFGLAALLAFMAAIYRV